MHVHPSAHHVPIPADFPVVPVLECAVLGVNRNAILHAPIVVRIHVVHHV